MPEEIGVVLVKPHTPSLRQMGIASSRALSQDPLAGFILRHQFAHGSTFRSRILRMGVIIVKTRPVRKNQVAFDLLEAQWPVFVDFIVGRFIRILAQLPRARARQECLALLGSFLAQRTFVMSSSCPARSRTGQGISDY